MIQQVGVCHRRLSRRCFFELWKLGVSDKLDIKVAPLALTPEIVEKYDLPPAPVPEKKLGAKTLQDRWLREFGSLVEIDSLVALYPGELENIIEGKVGRYVDTDLSKTINETLKEARETVEKSIRDVLEQKRDEFQSKKSKAKEVIDEINKLIADVYEQNKETFRGFLRTVWMILNQLNRICRILILRATMKWMRMMSFGFSIVRETSKSRLRL